MDYAEKSGRQAEVISSTRQQGTIDLVKELFQQTGNYLVDLGRLFLAEAEEKTAFLKVLAISAVVAALFAACGFLLLSVALVCLVAYGLGSWGWAFCIVGVAWVIVAGLVIMPAMRSLSKGALRFEKTTTRVKDDKEWIKQKLAA